MILRGFCYNLLYLLGLTQQNSIVSHCHKRGLWRPRTSTFFSWLFFQKNSKKSENQKYQKRHQANKETGRPPQFWKKNVRNIYFFTSFKGPHFDCKHTLNNEIAYPLHALNVTPKYDLSKMLWYLHRLLLHIMRGTHIYMESVWWGIVQQSQVCHRWWTEWHHHKRHLRRCCKLCSCLVRARHQPGNRRTGQHWSHEACFLQRHKKIEGW